MSTPLLELVASIMELDPSQVHEDSGMDSLPKWDSMRQLMLASMLESEFGFTLSAGELQNLQSVRKIWSILAAHDVRDA